MMFDVKQFLKVRKLILISLIMTLNLFMVQQIRYIPLWFRPLFKGLFYVNAMFYTGFLFMAWFTRKHGYLKPENEEYATKELVKVWLVLLGILILMEMFAMLKGLNFLFFTDVPINEAYWI